MELKFSNVGKETFHPWKFIFPPLEILFSKAGKFLENSQEDPLCGSLKMVDLFFAETDVG